jgi:hypothetical protein
MQSSDSSRAPCSSGGRTPELHPHLLHHEFFFSNQGKVISIRRLIHTAIFRWVRPRPRGQTLGGDPCLSTGDTREALPAGAQAHQLGRTHLKPL